MFTQQFENTAVHNQRIKRKFYKENQCVVFTGSGRTFFMTLSIKNGGKSNFKFYLFIHHKA